MLFLEVDYERSVRKIDRQALILRIALTVSFESGEPSVFY
jgi:hypothetical protein